MPPATEVSGGSAANTVAGIASLGAPAGLHRPGRRRRAGRVFTHDIRAADVHFDPVRTLDDPIGTAAA